MSNEEKVSLTYGERCIESRPGKRLLDTILDAGFDHRHVCGGNGFCTSCRVEIVGESSGLSPVSRRERDRRGSEAGRLRLACQSILVGSVAVRIPPPVSSR